MTVLEITIQRGLGDVRTVVLEHSRPDSLSPIRKEGELRLGDDTRQRLLQLEIDPRSYGELLGKALFSGRTREAFLQARSRDRDGLRVRLFVEDKELQRLYWGRLCAPVDDDGWDFLALDQLATFALYLPSSTDRAYRPIGQRDLAALLLVAEPENLGSYSLAEFGAAATVTSLRKALGDIPCEVLASTPGAAGLPTLDELCRRLRERQQTLLHVVAHGQVKDGETYLFLANESNQVERVAGKVLIRELRRLNQLPHFVFLATCHSAQPAAGLGGLAQRLVTQLGVPAAIAMTEAVSIDTAEALAEAFYAQLRASGEPDVALARACAGLTRRTDITVPALYSRLGDRPLFSDTPDRDLTASEIEYGLRELSKLLPERAPILQETFAAQESIVRGVLGTDRTALSEASRRAWNDALARVNSLCEEVLDLGFRALAFGKRPPPYNPLCPFRGLLAFGYADRKFFFGREPLVNKLLDKLAAHIFLPVLGPSGSGKSSIVLAGLIPALLKEEPGLQWVSFTPGNDPLAHLKASLSKLPAGSGDQPMPVGDSRSANREPRFLLVVDQFEELFTLCRDEQVRRDFLERLLSLAQEQRVVITMRADFWGDCAPYTRFKEEMQANQELVPPMTTAELRSAIEQQAKVVGLRFEADLANTILDAVQGEPGAMPLLQHLLLELWRRRHGRWLLTKEYRAIGGAQQAIACTADDVYKQMSPLAQEHMRDILVRLTRLDEDTVPVEGRRDTRRRTAFGELIPVTSNAKSMRDLVQHLASERLLVISVNSITGEEEIEVSHEALIQYWPRLRKWLDEDRSIWNLRAGIGREAREWNSHGRDESYLLRRGKRLEEIEKLLAHPKFVLNERERAYLGACFGMGEVSALALAPEALPLLDIVISIYKEKEVYLRFDDPASPGMAGEYKGLLVLPPNLPHQEEDPIVHGRILRDALLSSSGIHAEFLRSLALTVRATPSRPLRIALRLPTELHWLGWETLLDPIDDQPLLGRSDIYFSRFASPQGPIRATYMTSAQPRTLVFIANPERLASESIVAGNVRLHPVDVPGELWRARRALSPLVPEEVTSAAGQKGAASLESLLSTLSDPSREPFRFLYLVCHGAIYSGKPHLWLDQRDNRPVDAQHLIDGLRNLDPLRLPQLAVLVPCGNGNQPGRENSASVDRGVLAALGPGLVQAGVSVVVAMQSNVLMRSVEVGMPAFFQELLLSGQVERAMAEVRGRLRIDSDPLIRGQWHVPVLFSCLRNGHISLPAPPAPWRQFLAERVVEES